MIRIIIFPKFEIGQIVYMICDSEKKGCITGICIREDNRLLYLVTWANQEAYNYAFELTSERTFEGIASDVKEK